MWDVSNEYRLFRDDDWAEKMGTFVKQCDPYDHLTSTHGHGDFRFRQSPWADLAMFQSWDEHGGYDYMLKNRIEQEQTGRVIPQVNEEYGYEDHYPQGWGENRKAPARSAETRARIAWEIYLAGGYQTTGERADRGTGWGPDTGGGWINDPDPERDLLWPALTLEPDGGKNRLGRQHREHVALKSLHEKERDHRNHHPGDKSAGRRRPLYLGFANVLPGGQDDGHNRIGRKAQG